MNTTIHGGAGVPAAPRVNRTRITEGAFWAALTTAGSFGLGAWALHTASGVTQLSETDYNTEFINGRFLWLAYVLLIGVWLAAKKHVVAGLVAAVGLTAGQTWAMTVCVQRYRDSGWGDGLEVLGYLGPIFFGLFALAIVFGTWLVSRRRAGRGRSAHRGETLQG